MSLLLGDMLVRYKADISDLTAKTAVAIGEVDSFSSGAKVAGMAVAGALIATGVAIVGIGVLSTKMAADFQQSTNLLITSAGEIPGNIDMIRKGLLQMSVDTATSTDDLVKGMFNIESAGYHGAAALKIEQAAAEGAKVENADLAAVTDVLTTAMHNYNLPASQAVDTMNSFRLSASIGKMRMDDLTGALRNVLPIASQAGVKLTDVEAALSTMSLAGDKGTMAGTHLSMMLTQLLVPTAKATAALKTVGLTTQQISDEMKVSLPGAVQMITQAVGEKFPVGSAKYIAALSAIVGGNKQMKAMLELSGVSMSTFIKDASLLGPTMKANSTAVDGWNVVQSNANFKMDAAKNSVAALMIVIGTQLLPVISGLLDKIIPVIGGFAKWLTEGDRLKNSLHTVGDALVTIGGVIGKVATGIGDIVGFFIKGSAPAQILGVALLMIAGGFAAIQIGAFIAAVPAIVTGFIAWSVAAWSAAIATIAATWPIFLIGAAVVLVVALIIIAVRNWGAISAWLVGAWKAAIGWLGGALNSIGAFFVSVWNWIKSATTSAWNFLVDIVKAGAHFLYLAIFGPILLIVALFEWLYNHNYYFKMLIDTIVNVVKAGLAWLEGAWKATIGWLGGAWHSLVGIASSAWNAVRNAVMSVVTPVINWLSSTWNGEIRMIGALWGLLKGLASKAWDAVVGVFKSVWGPISGALSSLWSSISGWFTGLVPKMLSFGKNLIQGLIDGINSMLGAIGNAASNVASTITGILGFHSPPPYGPAHDADRWMPRLIKMFVTDLNAGVSPVQKASQNVASSLQQPLAYPIKPSAVAVAAASQSAQQSSGQGQTIILELDSHRIAQAVNVATDRTVRLKLGDRGRAA